MPKSKSACISPETPVLSRLISRSASRDCQVKPVNPSLKWKMASVTVMRRSTAAGLLAAAGVVRANKTVFIASTSSVLPIPKSKLPSALRANRTMGWIISKDRRRTFPASKLLLSNSIAISGKVAIILPSLLIRRASTTLISRPRSKPRHTNTQSSIERLTSGTESLNCRAS